MEKKRYTLDDVAAAALTVDPGEPEQLEELAAMIEAFLGTGPELGAFLQPLETFPDLLRQAATQGVAPIQREATLIRLGQLLEEIVEPTEEADQGTSPDSTSESPLEIEIGIDIDEEIVGEFITESLDHIDHAEQALLLLEENPDDTEAVNTIFRAFHTIKGSSAFLGLSQVEKLAHAAESLLSQVRDQSVVFSSSVADVILQSADTLRELLDGVRRTVAGESSPVPGAYHQLLEILLDPELTERIQTERPIPTTRTPEESPARKEGPEQRTTPAESDESVRIRVHLLDHLVDLVGELVVSQSMLSQEVMETIVEENTNGERVERILNRSNKILRELQDLSTSLRMVPLRPVFNRLARVARDAARKNRKEVQLITSGEETELDRNMVNALADPLIHMVRNAIDHGIESAEERRAHGKPEVGRLTISAYHSGGNVIVKIEDDGKGLDRERILARARERGIIDSEKGLTDAEIHQLVFAPGFSTAREVTAISGRGVGMDVVRRGVEELRGRIDIDSVPGKGTRFEIQLPLTLAITDGILIRVGTERYIIPTTKVQMSYRPSSDAISTMAGKGEMVLVHGNVLPVIRLYRLFGIEPDQTEPSEAILVIIREGARRSALMVDEVLGQQQFVVKAMTGSLTNVEGIAGGAIMGDGTVGLILDPEGLMSIATTGGEKTIDWVPKG